MVTVTWVACQPRVAVGGLANFRVLIMNLTDVDVFRVCE